MKRAPKFEAISREYATLWDSMEITRDESVMQRTASLIIKHRAAYEEVERLTGVPWYVIGIMDMREGGGGAKTHLHNGDSLARKTRNVPANRPAGEGPFTFCESACDALKIKGLDKLRDWSVERMAYEFERYNGFGYRQYRSMRSPYLWGGTNHQDKGKYIRDGVFSKSVTDPQHGCMPLLKVIADECEIELRSMYGATPDPTVPSPASNAKAEEKDNTNAIVGGTVGGVGVAGIIGPEAIAQLAPLSSNLVQVKDNIGTIMTGGPMLAGLILIAALGVCVWLVLRENRA